MYIYCMTFVNWLSEELKERNWTRSELARRAGFSDVALTLIYGGKRNPGVEICRGIAKAFKIDPEVVFQIAGLLPSPKDTDKIIEEILYDLGGFGMTDKEEIREYIKMKRRIAEKNGNYSPND